MTVLATGSDVTLERLLRVVLDCVRPRRVVLFGSRARGEPAELSDYDVYLEVDVIDGVSEVRSLVWQALHDAKLSADVIVATKRVYDDRRDDPGTIEWDVAREGVVLYSRPGVTDARLFERPAAAVSVAEWLARSDVDYRTVDTLLAGPLPDPEPVSFHAHDGAEKLLKAFIVSTGRRPRRTHLLVELLEQCSGELRSALLDPAALLDRVWPRARYPENGVVTRADGEAAVAAARLVREAVRPLVLRT